MQPTIYPGINELLATVLTRMQSVLRDTLRGLYLYGSATAGDFDPVLSDVDLLAVTAADLSAAEFAALDAMHRGLSLTYPAWKDRIEVDYLAAAALQNFKQQRSAITVISPGEPLNTKDAGSDWLINWYTVQENGIVLFGPPPPAFIPAISRAEFLVAVRVQARAWQERMRQYTPESSSGSLAYAVFTMCRGMYARATGEQTSKKRAAAWVAAAFPQWQSLIADATAWRAVQWIEPQPHHDTALPRVADFVAFATNKILEDTP